MERWLTQSTLVLLAAALELICGLLGLPQDVGACVLLGARYLAQPEGRCWTEAMTFWLASQQYLLDTCPCL
jgi:hypothetical protein